MQAGVFMYQLSSEVARWLLEASLTSHTFI